MKLTPTMRAALRALYEHGGEGVITKTGTLLSAGEELNNGEQPQPTAYHSVTWLRLVAQNLLHGCGAGRLRLTTMGFEAAKKA